MIQQDIKKRLEYQNKIKDINLLDLTGNKSTNYGFYLYDDLVVAKKDSIVDITEFEDQRCLNFVYESFKNIYSKLEYDSVRNLLSFDSIFNINKFKIIRSYENPLSKYKNYLLEVYKIYRQFVKNIKINNFNDFMINLQNLLYYNDIIFTFSSYVKSRKLNIYSSGLSLKYSDKTNEEILNDPSFEYFNSICNQNKFFMEGNDLSKIIYLLENKDEYVKSYTFLYQTDISLFINAIYTLYDYYYDEFLTDKIDNRKFLTSKQIINFYTKLKLHESGKRYSESTIDQTLKEIYFALGLKDTIFVTKLIMKLTNDQSIDYKILGSI